ncbi:MAG: hypothetical protein ACRBCT_08925 [Alphaproteobacteria bacterium]
MKDGRWDTESHQEGVSLGEGIRSILDDFLESQPFKHIPFDLSLDEAGAVYQNLEMLFLGDNDPDRTLCYKDFSFSIKGADGRYLNHLKEIYAFLKDKDGKPAAKMREQVGLFLNPELGKLRVGTSYNTPVKVAPQYNLHPSPSPVTPLGNIGINPFRAIGRGTGNQTAQPQATVQKPQSVIAAEARLDNSPKYREYIAGAEPDPLDALKEAATASLQYKTPIFSTVREVLRDTRAQAAHAVQSFSSGLVGAFKRAAAHTPSKRTLSKAFALCVASSVAVATPNTIAHDMGENIASPGAALFTAAVAAETPTAETLAEKYARLDFQERIEAGLDPLGVGTIIKTRPTSAEEPAIQIASLSPAHIVGENIAPKEITLPEEPSSETPVIFKAPSEIPFDAIGTLAPLSVEFSGPAGIKEAHFAPVDQTYFSGAPEIEVYTVEKDDSLSRIVRRDLRAQGENPDDQKVFEAEFAKYIYVNPELASEPWKLALGQEIIVPPTEGAGEAECNWWRILQSRKNACKIVPPAEEEPAVLALAS